MKIWWVLSGDNYYPSWDNFIDSFETESEAIEFKNNYRDEYNRRPDWFLIINISERL